MIVVRCGNTTLFSAKFLARASAIATPALPSRCRETTKPSAVSSGLVIRATKSPICRPRRTRSSRHDTLRSMRTSTCSQPVGWVSISSPNAWPLDLSGRIVPVMNSSGSSMKMRTRAPAANRAEKVPTGTSSSRPLSLSPRTMQPMVSECTTSARSVVADSPGSSAVSAPRRVSVNGTPKSSRMSPITCITASVRPDGLGVCSSASSVSTIHVRSASAMAAVWPTSSPFRSGNRVQPTVWPTRAAPARASALLGRRVPFGDQIGEGEDPLRVAHVQTLDHPAVDGDDAGSRGLRLLVGRHHLAGVGQLLR